MCVCARVGARARALVRAGARGVHCGLSTATLGSTGPPFAYLPLPPPSLPPPLPACLSIRPTVSLALSFSVAPPPLPTVPPPPALLALSCQRACDGKAGRIQALQLLVGGRRASRDNEEIRARDVRPFHRPAGLRRGRRARLSKTAERSVFALACVQF